MPTTRPSPKLDYHRLGPFKILDCVGETPAEKERREEDVFQAAEMSGDAKLGLLGRYSLVTPIANDTHHDLRIVTRDHLTGKEIL
jgi:hypothetical protein